MKSRFSKGFTLIELLVVVAIIGILSSIVLVSLNSARNKGRDASAKGSMSSARAAAEIYFDTNNDYGNPVGPVTVDGSITPVPVGQAVNAANDICEYRDVVSLLVAVSKQIGAVSNCQVQLVPASYTLWGRLNDGRTYCVDGKGYAGYVTGTAPTNTNSIVDGLGCL